MLGSLVVQFWGPKTSRKNNMDTFTQNKTPPKKERRQNVAVFGAVNPTGNPDFVRLRCIGRCMAGSKKSRDMLMDWIHHAHVPCFFRAFFSEKKQFCKPKKTLWIFVCWGRPKKRGVKKSWCGETGYHLLAVLWCWRHCWRVGGV